MKDDNDVRERTFSFYINKLGKPSFIDVGQPQTRNIRGGTGALRYIPTVADDFFWSAYNQGVAFGGTITTESSYAYGTNEGYDGTEIVDGATYSIFDSSLSYIAISALHFDTFIDKLFEEVGGYDYEIAGGIGVSTNGVLMTRCDYAFPPVHFMFNNYWVRIDKDDYFYDTSEAQDGSVCALRFVQHSENFNVFGTPLMFGYYVVFDVDEHRIGFGPNSVSTKTTLRTANADILINFLHQEDASYNWPSIFLLAVAAIALMLVWIYCALTAITDIIAKAVSTIVWMGAVATGEYFLYKWMVRKNVFGATGFAGQDADMIRVIAMITYAFVATAVYRAVMKRLSEPKEQRIPKDLEEDYALRSLIVSELQKSNKVA